MKKLLIALSLFVTSLTHAFNCCEENPRCLPIPESGEILFPLCKSIFGSVEFLYWNAAVGALDYAVKMKGPSWAPADDENNYANGCVDKGCFEWNPGVRASLGYYNAPRLWLIMGEYTYYQGCGSSGVKKPSDVDLFLNGTFPQPSDVLAGSFLLEAKSDIHLHYHLGEALFARVFDPNPHLRLNLLAGASGVYFAQEWDVHYLDNFDNDTLIKNCWSYKAGGLRAGISAEWWWKWCLYLTGRATFAGYVGCYKNHALETTTVEPVGFDASHPVVNICYDDTRLAPHMQFILGPSWQSVGRCFHYALAVGYEINVWLNLQEIYRSERGQASDAKILGTKTNALALHGLTARVTLGF